MLDVLQTVPTRAVRCHTLFMGDEIVQAVPMSSEGPTSEWAGGFVTGFVPPPAAADPGLAWSEAAGSSGSLPVVVVRRRPWGAVWLAAFVVVAGCVAVGLVIMLVWWDPLRPPPRVSPPVQVPAVVVPSRAPLMSKDDLFLATLEAHEHWHYVPGPALAAAQWVCSELGKGVSWQSVVDRDQAGNPQLRGGQVADFVKTSVEFYCPQYAGREKG